MARKDGAPVVPNALSLGGRHAKALHRMKPGASVKLHVTGRLTDIGDGAFGEGPTARVEVRTVRPAPGKPEPEKAGKVQKAERYGGGDGRSARAGGLRARRPARKGY